MAKVIEGLYYSESHEYVRVEGNIGYIGITDYAQEQLGNVVYVDMPEEGDEVTATEHIPFKSGGLLRNQESELIL